MVVVVVVVVAATIVIGRRLVMKESTFIEMIIKWNNKKQTNMQKKRE